MTLLGSSKLVFYARLAANKAAPIVRTKATEASITILFPCIRPEEIHVQWYSMQRLNEHRVEKNEIIHKPAEGRGIWYQGDIAAKEILSKDRHSIGISESLRVLEWLDATRSLAGIKYDPILDEVRN